MRNDLSIYSEYANEWWIPGAPRFRSLQNITPFRLSLIEEFLGDIRGKTVVDVGCGGGLISIPLLRQGVSVIGFDLSEASIAAARASASNEGTFSVADARNLPLPDNSADHVLLMDIVDHIPDYPKALAEVARIVRPGGRVIVGTINRTIRSRVFAVWLAETIGLIPPGTHDHSLFVRPEELHHAAQASGLELLARQGERLKILETIRRWAISLEKGSSVALAYTMIFRKKL